MAHRPADKKQMKTRTSHRDDRRRFPRAQFTWRAAIGHKDEQELVNATTHDISMGGVCVSGPLSAVPGDELVLLLSLKDRIVPAVGSVIRAEIVSPDEVKLHMEFSWFSEFGLATLSRLTRVRDPRPAPWLASAGAKVTSIRP
jgi:hypothetical protein